MKQLISIFVFILIGTVLAEGEEMKFVTVLSSPVGTFAQLETANPTRAVKSPVVNFGTSRVTVGRIELKGAAGYIEDLYLQSGTELGGNAGAYRVAEGMEVGTGGRITGGRLMANEVDFSGALEGKSEVKGSLYIDEISVAGAKAGSLTIPDEVELTASSGEEEVLEWSNEYDCDYQKMPGKANYELKVGDWAGCWVNEDTCDGHMISNYDYKLNEIKANPYTKSFSCVDMAVNPNEGVKGVFDADGIVYPKGDMKKWYDLHMPTSNKDNCRGFPYYYRHIMLPDAACPGLNDGEYIVYGEEKNKATGKVEASWKYYLNAQELTTLDQYAVQLISDGTDYDGWVQIGCAGDCYEGCPYIAIDGFGYKHCTSGNLYEDGGTKLDQPALYYPVIFGYVRVYCRQIDYKFLGIHHEAGCKSNSPKYDSYLLKSKSTTSSSDSKEEGTEG